MTPSQVGVALNKSWEAKRSLASGVSNTMLDAAVDAAVDAGATGAKVAGAGGGGFVLVVCPVEHQAAARVALSEMKELARQDRPLRLEGGAQRPSRHLGLTLPTQTERLWIRALSYAQSESSR